MMNHANTPSPNRSIDRDDQNPCAVRPVPKYILADTVDGPRWHPVATVDEGDYRADDVIVTECGLRVQWIDADEIVHEDDEKPHFSGNTICYGCCR